MNVVNSGAAIGYQAHFDSVWMCLVWVQVGKSLGSGLHPAYRELYLTVCKSNTFPSSQLKYQRWSWVTCEGSFTVLFPTTVLYPGVLWLVPEVLLYLGWCIHLWGEL